MKIFVYRNIFLGFLSWLIPFAVAFFCYTPDGTLTMEYSTFKSIMTVSGTVSGSFLLYLFFKAVKNDFVSAGVIVGFSWLAINIILDSIVLIPMMKVSFPAYLSSVGLSYLSIPAISIAIGCIVSEKLKDQSIVAE